MITQHIIDKLSPNLGYTPASACVCVAQRILVLHPALCKHESLVHAWHVARHTKKMFHTGRGGGL